MKIKACKIRLNLIGPFGEQNKTDETRKQMRRRKMSINIGIIQALVHVEKMTERPQATGKPPDTVKTVVV